MESHRAILLVGVIALGCTSTQNDTGTTSAVPDYEGAMETLATSSDLAAVNASLRTLYGGGRPAINALRKHLSDERVLQSEFSARIFTANSKTKMSDESFWIIQDIVETPLPKLYRGNYYALTRDSVEQWLDRYNDASIAGLQIEAASASLDLAKRDFEMTGSPHAREAIEICRERLTELRRLK